MITSPRAAARGARRDLAVLGKGAISQLTSDFESDYQRRLSEAHERARAEGRGDVAEYLDVRAANDRLRSSGVEWLVERFTALAGEANRGGAGLSLARSEAHRFRVGNSTMVGTEIVLRRGVRTLTIEAGWPRMPGDGVVRGGGLACARVGHFGHAAANEELLLLPSQEGAPRWFVLEKTGARAELEEGRLRQHLSRLIA
jgi:hypothetical protein